MYLLKAHCLTFFHCGQCPEAVQEDVIFISDDLTHDTHAVHQYQ